MWREWGLLFKCRPVTLNICSACQALRCLHKHQCSPHRHLLIHGRRRLFHDVHTCISLWDAYFHANTEIFQGLVPLLPHLCPLSVPKGDMWGIFGTPLKGGIWNTQVCMLY